MNAATAADRAGARLVTGTAQVLEGLLVLGLIEHARGLDALPDILLPPLPAGPDRDAALFLAGASAATAAAARRWRGGGWDPEEFAAVTDQLRAAGYDLMSRRTARAISAAAVLGDPASGRPPL
ncbi:hypothetical protein OG618_37415 (plasmid) [Kitasatospora sp. NBC_01246]|uniref:hypothetical protein n=1 Tax=Kitasatospora sp. NBC_01246 TaxID=2903570 RepID=UPI002E37FD26|nr:hypothetical protein [Kitasatospora sp. NBC_01246]